MIVIALLSLTGTLQSMSEVDNTAEENERNRIREEERKEQERERLAREEEQKVKRKENRDNVIAEILSTEADYYKSLSLCLETFAALEAAEKVYFMNMRNCQINN